MPHLFTKSRFKIGLECPTKLFCLDQISDVSELDTLAMCMLGAS